MKFQLLTKHTGMMHISFISALLGMLLNGLFIFMNSVFHVQNIAVAIILFTVVIYAILTPLTYQQQKFSLLQSRMNPELQAIQAKYKGKTDNASMMQMREETKFIYSKYGVTTVGTCLMPLISLLILFNLLFVVYSIPAYIHPVGDAIKPLATALVSDQNAVNTLEQLTSHLSGYSRPDFKHFAGMDPASQLNVIIDSLYQLNPEAWNNLHSQFPNVAITMNGAAVADGVAHTADTIGAMTNFMGMNISDTPIRLIKGGMWGAILVPILSAVVQFLNFKLMPKAPNMDDNPMGKSMQSMNYIMPIFSAWFCLSFPVGIGIYWISGPIIRSLQQIFINKHIKKINVEDLIQKNLLKINTKRAKDGLPPITDVSGLTKPSAAVPKMTEESKKRVEVSKSRSKNIDSSKFYEKEPAEGSLAAKARMVERLNEKKNEN